MGSPIPQPLKNVAALNRIAGLTPAQIEALHSYWIISIQEFLAVFELAGGREALKTILELEDSDLDTLRKGAASVVGPERSLAWLEKEALKADYQLGVVVSPPERDISYDGIAFPGPLPTLVDYSPQLPPVRDQGIRSTCVAHAAAAVREFLEIKAGLAAPGAINLSEQYIYWWCKQNDNLPTVAGTYPHLGLTCLAKAGTVTETDWPYSDLLVPDSEGQGPPPKGIESQAWRYKVKRVLRLEPHDVTAIKTALATGRAVLFAIPVYDSWFRNRVSRTSGKINLPLPGELSNGAHAMVLIGYVDDETAPGGGYFLVRNSWTPWGFDSPFPGCGTISYEFIARHNMTAATGDRVSLADAYVRNDDQDTGQASGSGVYHNSPDLWLRRVEDGQEGHQTPALGVPNYLYVRAWNQGPEVANKVTATVYVAPLSTSLWPDHWRPAGSVTFPDIPAATSAIAAVCWIPVGAGPYSFLVKLASAADPAQPGWSARDDNNVALKSLAILRLHPGDSGQVQFPMYGPPSLPDAMDLIVDRDRFPRGRVHLRMGERASNGNGARLQENPAKLAGLAAQATMAETVGVTITADANARPGERGEIVITQHYDSLLVGRLAVQIEIVG